MVYNTSTILVVNLGLFLEVWFPRAAGIRHSAIDNADHIRYPNINGRHTDENCH